MRLTFTELERIQTNATRGYSDDPAKGRVLAIEDVLILLQDVRACRAEIHDLASQLNTARDKKRLARAADMGARYAAKLRARNSQ